MTWLLWRQHRAQWAIALALTALFAVPVWITGQHLRTALTGCADGCSGELVFHGYSAINIVVDLTVVLPIVIGVFWGASVVGKELEFGTAALVWTQSTSRRRWLAAKLLALLAASAVGSGVVTALVSWWSFTHNALLESRFGGLQFDIQGVVPIGYTVFAAALGFAAGAFWRRTLPAMATTLAGFVAVRLLVELYVRPHLRSPVVAVTGLAKGEQLPQGALNLGSTVLLHGRVVSGSIRMPAQCRTVTSRNGMDRCLQGLGYQLRTTYQPAGRYWTFQWIEFVMFVVLAAVCVATGVVVLRRRDA